MLYGGVEKERKEETIQLHYNPTKIFTKIKTVVILIHFLKLIYWSMEELH